MDSFLTRSNPPPVFLAGWYTHHTGQMTRTQRNGQTGLALRHRLASSLLSCYHCTYSMRLPHMAQQRSGEAHLSSCSLVHALRSCPTSVPAHTLQSLKKRPCYTNPWRDSAADDYTRRIKRPRRHRLSFCPVLLLASLYVAVPTPSPCSPDCSHFALQTDTLHNGQRLESSQYSMPSKLDLKLNSCGIPTLYHVYNAVNCSLLSQRAHHGAQFGPSTGETSASPRSTPSTSSLLCLGICWCSNWNGSTRIQALGCYCHCHHYKVRGTLSSTGPFHK